MKKGVKIYNRLSREKISKDHFRLIDNITDDLILKEYYDEEHIEDVTINVSEILNMDLKNSNRYLVFQYGQSHFKSEHSHFTEYKKQDFANRKCDISLIIVDHLEEQIYLVCAEVKKTLRIDSLYEARQQLISTYIDLNILSSLVTFNIYPLKRIFFIVSYESIIPSKSFPSNLKLLKDKKGRNLPSELIWTEYTTNTFYFALDLLEDMQQVNQNLSQLVDWASDAIIFKIN